MKILFILNNAPYGLEQNYNALRLASSLARKNVELKVFLFSDAVLCAKKGQSVPQGYYNIEHMLKLVGKQGGEISVCGSCMDARGIAEDMLAEGAKRGTMAILTEWTAWADKVLVF